MKPLFKQKEFTDEVIKFMFARMVKESKKIGLREFAKQIGISSATLSRIENGSSPDLETFFRLCKWMDKSPNEFYNHKTK